MSFEKIPNKEDHHDFARAEILLGPRYNGHEIPYIFSYMQPEESKTLLDKLEEQLESTKTEDEKKEIRDSWVKQAIEFAESKNKR